MNLIFEITYMVKKLLAVIEAKVHEHTVKCRTNCNEIIFSSYFNHPWSSMVGAICSVMSSHVDKSSQRKSMLST